VPERGTRAASDLAQSPRNRVCENRRRFCSPILTRPKRRGLVEALMGVSFDEVEAGYYGSDHGAGA